MTGSGNNHSSSVALERLILQFCSCSFPPSLKVAMEMPYLSSIQLRNLWAAAIVKVLRVWCKGNVFIGSLSLYRLLCACQQMAEWWKENINCPLLETLFMWLELHLKLNSFISLLCSAIKWPYHIIIITLISYVYILYLIFYCTC